MVAYICAMSFLLLKIFGTPNDNQNAKLHICCQWSFILVTLKGDALLITALETLSLWSYIKQWCHLIIPWRTLKGRCYRLQHKRGRRREAHNDPCNQNSLKCVRAHASHLAKFVLKLMTWHQLIFKETFKAIYLVIIFATVCAVYAHTHHTPPSSLHCVTHSVICVRIRRYINRCHLLFSTINNQQCKFFLLQSPQEW